MQSTALSWRAQKTFFSDRQSGSCNTRFLPPPLSRNYNRDPNTKAPKRSEFINQVSTLLVNILPGIQ